MSATTYDFNYFCGHRGSLTRNDNGRADNGKRYIGTPEQTIKGFETTEICNDCKAAYLKKMDAFNKKTDSNLPALQGSEKQIAWATELRKADIELINGISTHWYGKTKEVQNAFEDAIRETKGNDSAAWWIDNHMKTNTLILRKVNEAIGADRNDSERRHFIIVNRHI